MNCPKMRLPYPKRPVKGIYCQAIPTTPPPRFKCRADFCNNVGADVAYRNTWFSFEIDQGISYEYKDAEDNKAVHIYPD
jgi:hypothetical protein